MRRSVPTDSLYQPHVLKAVKALAPNEASIHAAQAARQEYWTRYRNRPANSSLLNKAQERFEMTVRGMLSDARLSHFKELAEMSGLPDNSLSRALHELQSLRMVRKQMRKYGLTARGIDLSAVVLSEKDLLESGGAQNLKAVSTEQRRRCLAFLAVAKQARVSEVASATGLSVDATSKILWKLSSTGLVRKVGKQNIIGRMGRRLCSFAQEVQSCVDGADGASLPLDLAKAMHGSNRTLEHSIQIYGCSPSRRTRFISEIAITLSGLGFVPYGLDMNSSSYLLVMEPLAAVVRVSVIEGKEGHVGVDAEWACPLKRTYVASHMTDDLPTNDRVELGLESHSGIDKERFNNYITAMLIAGSKVVNQRLRRRITESGEGDVLQVQEDFNGIFFQWDTPPQFWSGLSDLRYFGGVTSL